LRGAFPNIALGVLFFSAAFVYSDSYVKVVVFSTFVLFSCLLVMPSRRSGRKQRKGGKRRSVPSNAANHLGRPMGFGPTFTFRRHWQQAFISLTSAASTQGAVTLSWATMPSPMQAFLLAFDLIRVKFARVVLVPDWTVNTTGSISASQLPSLVVVPNYDNGGSASTFDSVCGKVGARVHYQWYRAVSLTVTPSYLTNAGNVSPYTTLMSPIGSWLNTSAVFQAGNSILSPCIEYGVSAVTNLPGGGRFAIWLDVTFECAQAFTGGQ